VKAALLSFSEVLEPMGDIDEGVLVSDDNVVQRGQWTFLNELDPDARLDRERQSSGWMAYQRARVSQMYEKNKANFLRFEINRKNMRELAHLSDKYIIESLRNDIRVRELYSTFSP
jgi:hypothetical protein